VQPIVNSDVATFYPTKLPKPLLERCEAGLCFWVILGVTRSVFRRTRRERPCNSRQWRRIMRKRKINLDATGLNDFGLDCMFEELYFLLKRPHDVECTAAEAAEYIRNYAEHDRRRKLGAKVRDRGSATKEETTAE